MPFPSCRIYEQLPEVRRKREEEQRRLEYSSYRLRAQLYKTVSAWGIGHGQTLLLCRTAKSLFTHLKFIDL